MKVKKATRLSAQTISRLKEVAEHILEEPKRLDMDNFGIGYDEVTEADRPHDVPACRTQACIGGWGILLNKPKIWKEMVLAADSIETTLGHHYAGSDVAAVARKILGLTKAQGQRLFFFTGWSWGREGGGNDGLGWPKKFEVAYYKAVGAKTRAKVTNERILHFIATNGAE